MAVVRPAAGIATRLSLSRYLVYRVSFNCTSQLNNRQKGDVASRTVPTPPNCEAGGGWNKAGGREGCARLRGREINTLWDGGERETYRIVGTALFSFNSYLSLSLSLLSKAIARTGAYSRDTSINRFSGRKNSSRLVFSPLEKIRNVLNLVSFLLFFFWSWIDRQADRRRCWQSRGGEISSRVAAGREKGVAVNRRHAGCCFRIFRKKKKRRHSRKADGVGWCARVATHLAHIHTYVYV